MASVEAEHAVAPYLHLLGRPDDVAADLDRFAALLFRWNTAQNLVSRETVATLWERHIADSLQVLPLLRSDDRQIVDLGSGGGFPALPLAIAAKGPGRHFILVEATAKKSAFLKAVIRELSLNVEVRQQRIESIDSRETPADVVTSRALAALPSLLCLAFPLFRAPTRGLFHKGREHGEELSKATLEWDFNVIIHSGVTGSGGVILEVSDLRPKEGRPEAEN